MRFPRKTEIAAVKYAEHDFQQALYSIIPVFRYHKVVCLLDHKTVIEGQGAARGRNTYQYFVCRRRWMGIVLFNLLVEYLVRLFLKPGRGE